MYKLKDVFLYDESVGSIKFNNWFQAYNSVTFIYNYHLSVFLAKSSYAKSLFFIFIKLYLDSLITRMDCIFHSNNCNDMT